MVKVKICGLTTKEAVVACADANADYIGFVCYPNSPRHVAPATFAALASIVAPTIATVLVTVNADDDTLGDYFEHLQPHYLQCHGNEPPERLNELQDKFGCKIIKALAVSEEADLAKAAMYHDSADLLLLDAKPAKGELPGGNARSFNWKILQNFSPPLPWMLSGGINRHNCVDALASSRATMLDISSGVEKARGVKDPVAIKEFIYYVQSLSPNT